MFKLTLYFVLLLVISLDGLAAKLPQASLNVTMTLIGEELKQILPIVTKKKSLDATQVKRIEASIKQLSELFNQIGPYIKNKPSGYQISYGFIKDYLQIMASVLKSGDIEYTRSYFYGLAEICSSCHTQDTALRTWFAGTPRASFPSDISYAEFNFITRNYSQAIMYYDKSLLVDTRLSDLEIIQPLQRLLTIYAQIENDPLNGAKVLKKYQHIMSHTKETKSQLEKWIAELEILAASPMNQSKNDTFASLEKYILQYLGQVQDQQATILPQNSNEAAKVMLRGKIYHYMNSNPAVNEIPILLYWLSIIDRSISYNFYFSMADLYLKKCVLDYASHPMPNYVLENISLT